MNTETFLHSVVSASCAESESSTPLFMMIDATVEGERSVFDFVYRPEDRYGLTAEVTDWLLSNPQFPIEPYEEPEEPLDDTN